EDQLRAVTVSWRPASCSGGAVGTALEERRLRAAFFVLAVPLPSGEECRVQAKLARPPPSAECAGPWPAGPRNGSLRTPVSPPTLAGGLPQPRTGRPRHESRCNRLL